MKEVGRKAGLYSLKESCNMLLDRLEKLLTAKLLHTYDKKIMKQHTLLGFFLVVMVLTLSSCELVGDIFQAGLFVGILIVVIIIALIIWLVSKFRR